MTDSKIDFWRFQQDIVKNTCKPLSETVASDLRKVSDIDQKIVDLVTERNYVLFGLNCKCLSSHVGRTCIGREPTKVWKEYKKSKFKSNIVREAVKDVRMLFFDDSIDAYKKFSCVQIIHREYGIDSDDISFVFEDSEKHSLELTFNYDMHKETNLYSHKILNGYIYLSTKIGRRYNYDVINRSFDPVDLRKSIEDWINNGYTAEPYKFEQLTLIDKIKSVFDTFKSMHGYDACCIQ